MRLLGRGSTWDAGYETAEDYGLRPFCRPWWAKVGGHMWVVIR